MDIVFDAYAPILHHFAGFKILISAKQITNNLPIYGFNVLLSPLLRKIKNKIGFCWALCQRIWKKKGI